MCAFQGSLAKLFCLLDWGTLGPNSKSGDWGSGGVRNTLVPIITEQSWRTKNEV